MINSHGGHLRAIGGSVKPEKACIPYIGTFVEFVISGNKAIDLDKALWGFETISHVQFSFQEESSDDLLLRLRDEESNFGNRPTGLKIRNLILNMMQQMPKNRIVVDFDEINLISSSFADEVFGKLASKLGVLNFSRILILKNTTNLVASLIDKAIAQRMAQDYAQINTSEDSQEIADF
ncbi:STAS-like domain-containing protein [Deinococcus radiomollis]|uniref:STAS-like domain-containing protein n=1 Tax=Deinococcus radiomollis TaxID=468916 RepID=UPI00389176D0